MILLKVDLLGANGGGDGSTIDNLFIIPNNTKKNMEHLRIVKQKFSNKKTTLRKKLSQTETLAFSRFLVAILFKICYPQKVYLHKIFQNWSSAKVFVITQNDKKFSKISTYFSYF